MGKIKAPGSRGGKIIGYDKKGNPVYDSNKSKHKGHITPTKEHLHNTLENGHYSLISAGPNPNDPKEKKLLDEHGHDHEFFKKRHNDLRNDLDAGGHSYTEVEGDYGSPEKTFMIHHHGHPKSGEGKGNGYMVHHHDDKDAEKNIDRIGKLSAKYNQDSFIHSKGGNHKMVFTTGDHHGEHHKGTGHEKLSSDTSEFYTEAPTAGGKSSRFRLNFDWDKHHPTRPKGHFGKPTKTYSKSLVLNSFRKALPSERVRRSFCTFVR